MRFLLTLFVALCVATLFFYALQNSGTVSINWQHYQVETSTSFLLTALLLVIVFSFWGGQLWTIVSAAPSWWKNRKKWSTQEKAIEQFVEAMELLQLGEREKAEKKAKTLTSKQNQLGGLLWTQIGADSPFAHKAIAHLSTAETGQVLSLMSLAKKAEKEGQWQTMKALMEQAYALKPSAPEVVYVLFKSYLHTAHFKEALALQGKLRFSAYYDAEEFDLLIASLGFIEAQKEEEKHKQRKAIEKVLQQEETFIPAMVYDLEVKEKSATQWAISCPHPRVLDIWHDSLERLNSKQLQKKQDALIKKITLNHPTYGTFVKGYLLYLADHIDEAYMLLKKATKDLPFKDVYLLLAQIEKERHTGEGPQQGKWLTAAIQAKEGDFIGAESISFWEKFKETYPVTEVERPSRLEHHIYDR